MRIGALDVDFSAGGGVDLPGVPSGNPYGVEAEAIALGADGPGPIVMRYANPLLSTAMQQAAGPSGAQRYAKYLGAKGSGPYAGASFAGSADEYKGAAPTERGASYHATAGGEISTGAIVAGGAVLAVLAALAAWRFGAFR